jgi:uncharacterized protein (TIGR00255 family)
MTGFGAAAGAVGDQVLTVEVRTVNHRFFTPSLKLPGVLTRWEPELREILRTRVARGHVTLSARMDRVGVPAAATLRIDPDTFGLAVSALRELQARHDLADTLDVATVLRVPGVLAAPVEEQVIVDPAPVLAVVQEAVSALLAMRDAEGARLREVLLERLAVAEAVMARIATRAPERLVAHRDRLSANVAQLLGGASLDPQRLAQEVALAAERWDIGEEIDRFRAHAAAFREALDAAATEAVGKRLGFLLQELLREANTTGSKANDAEMQRDVVAVKEELERLREQVENVE